MRLLRAAPRFQRARRRGARRTATPVPVTPATGTIKSLETPRGTGSIAPDPSAPIIEDTGFDRTKVQRAPYEALKVGDHVRFAAEPDPARPGYAHAVVVEPDPAS